MQLRTLGCSPEEFACVRHSRADRPWGEVVRHILAADTWLDLFADGW
ncbi:MAG: hypothetical protein M3069_18495 [Chloroflexota bacterium]|nr:hypothetical protein [Chloroflexota bacterium]